MEGIEEFKPELVGSLPKEEYLNLEPSTEDDETAAVRDYSLPASLLKIINRIPKDVSGDVFGKVYEYFWVSLLVTKAKAVVNTTRLPVLYALW